MEKLILELNRMEKGNFELSENVQKISEELFLVKSEFKEKKYLVNKVNGSFECECPDHVYRHVECKHIWAVKFEEQKTTVQPQISVNVESPVLDRTQTVISNLKNLQFPGF